MLVTLEIYNDPHTYLLWVEKAEANLLSPGQTDSHVDKLK